MKKINRGRYLDRKFLPTKKTGWMFFSNSVFADLDRFGIVEMENVTICSSIDAATKFAETKETNGGTGEPVKLFT